MTNLVSFPGLGLEFELNRVAVELFGRPIYWYGIIIATGMLLAVYLCGKWGKRFGITEDEIMDMMLFAVPAALVAVRVYYVLFNLELYRNGDGSLNWGAMLRYSDGGLAIYGAIIVAVLVAWLYARHKKIKIGALADLCVMGLLIGQAVGRWGNFMNREAFGSETTLPWRMRLWTTPAEFIEVHPTFLYESLWNMLGLLLILFVLTRGRRFDGENTWFYFLWYGLGRTWVEGLRTDSLYLFDWTLMGQPIRVSQALSIVMVVVSICMLVYNIKIRPHSPENLLVNQVAAAAEEEAPAEEPAPAEEIETTVEGDADGSEN